MIQRKRLGGACFAGATHFPDRFPKVVSAFAIVAATAGRYPAPHVKCSRTGNRRRAGRLVACGVARSGGLALSGDPATRIQKLGCGPSKGDSPWSRPSRANLSRDGALLQWPLPAQLPHSA